MSGSTTSSTVRAGRPEGRDADGTVGNLAAGAIEAPARIGVEDDLAFDAAGGDDFVLEGVRGVVRALDRPELRQRRGAHRYG